MSLFSKLFRGPVSFVESKVEQAKGEVRKEIANGMASVTMIIIMAVTALIVIFFLSAGLAMYLNIVMESEFLGFLVIGTFYLILLGFFTYLRNNEAFMERLRIRYRKEFGVEEEYEHDLLELTEESYREE